MTLGDVGIISAVVVFCLVAGFTYIWWEGRKREKTKRG